MKNKCKVAAEPPVSAPEQERKRGGEWRKYLNLEVSPPGCGLIGDPARGGAVH